MADLDHVYDVDNDVTYTLKDTEARGDIIKINSKLLNEVYPVCFCIAGGWVVQDREYNLTLSEWSNARFNPEYDNDVMNVRVSFYDFQTPSPFDDDILIDIDTFIEAQHRQLPVYLDKEKTIRATIGHIRGRTVDFIYVPLERCYYLVGSRIMSEDVVFDTTNTRLSSTNVQDAIAELDDDLALLTASQVGYDHTSSGLVAITVQDAIDEIAAGSGGGTAASTSYDNTGSGLQATDVQDAIDEVVDDLGDKADTSSLATVATTGDYDDLTDKPDLSELPYLENIAAAPEFNDSTRYNYRDVVKYNDKMYLCRSSSGSTPGSFDPSEWAEITTATQANETQRIALLASKNENDIQNLATVATTGDYFDLINTPTIPAAQVNSDWNANSGVAQILNKPNLSAVATSGDYDDLTDKPTFKTINGDAITGTGNITTPDTKPSDYNGQTSAAGVSLPHGTTWTELLSVNITAGYWLVNWGVNFASNGGTNTGYRGAGVATTGDPFAYMALQVPAITNNTYTLVSSCAIFKADNATTLRLKARQYSTSSTTLTATPRLQVIKIAPL